MIRPLLLGVLLLTVSLSACSDGDTAAFTQLLWDGTLRVDHDGEMPPRVHEVQVTDAELDDLQEKYFPFD